MSQGSVSATSGGESMLPELAQVFPSVNALSDPAKEQLVTILTTQLRRRPEPAEPVRKQEEEENDEPFVYDPNNPSLGLFYHEPEMVDEVLRLAMELRGHRYEGRENE